MSELQAQPVSTAIATARLTASASEHIGREAAQASGSSRPASYIAAAPEASCRLVLCVHC
jgi:hypothetical protein